MKINFVFIALIFITNRIHLGSCFYNRMIKLDNPDIKKSDENLDELSLMKLNIENDSENISYLNKKTIKNQKLDSETDLIGKMEAENTIKDLNKIKIKRDNYSGQDDYEYYDLKDKLEQENKKTLEETIKKIKNRKLDKSYLEKQPIEDTPLENFGIKKMDKTEIYINSIKAFNGDLGENKPQTINNPSPSIKSPLPQPEPVKAKQEDQAKNSTTVANPSIEDLNKNNLLVKTLEGEKKMEKKHLEFQLITKKLPLFSEMVKKKVFKSGFKSQINNDKLNPNEISLITNYYSSKDLEEMSKQYNSESEQKVIPKPKITNEKIVIKSAKVISTPKIKSIAEDKKVLNEEIKKLYQDNKAKIKKTKITKPNKIIHLTNNDVNKIAEPNLSPHAKVKQPVKEEKNISRKEHKIQFHMPKIDTVTSFRPNPEAKIVNKLDERSIRSNEANEIEKYREYMVSHGMVNKEKNAEMKKDLKKLRVPGRGVQPIVPAIVQNVTMTYRPDQLSAVKKAKENLTKRVVDDDEYLAKIEEIDEIDNDDKKTATPPKNQDSKLFKQLMESNKTNITVKAINQLVLNKTLNSSQTTTSPLNTNKTEFNNIRHSLETNVSEISNLTPLLSKNDTISIKINRSISSSPITKNSSQPISKRIKSKTKGDPDSPPTFSKKETINDIRVVHQIPNKSLSDQKEFNSYFNFDLSEEERLQKKMKKLHPTIKKQHQLSLEEELLKKINNKFEGSTISYVTDQPRRIGNTPQPPAQAIDLSELKKQATFSVDSSVFNRFLNDIKKAVPADVIPRPKPQPNLREFSITVKQVNQNPNAISSFLELPIIEERIRKEHEERINSQSLDLNSIFKQQFQAFIQNYQK